MKLYIDIDGVILDGGNLARGAKAFLTRAVDEYDCFWLTTHKSGSVDYLRPKVDAETLAVLKRIQPARWGMMKTEALDAEADDWIWLDDAPLAAEIEWLRTHGCESQWVKIDHAADPDALEQWFG